MYFKIQGTYFKIYALYFSSFQTSEKQYFTKRSKKSRCFSRLAPSNNTGNDSCLHHSFLHCAHPTTMKLIC